MAERRAGPHGAEADGDVMERDQGGDGDLARDGGVDRCAVSHWGQHTIDGGAVNLCDGGEWMKPVHGAPRCEACEDAVQGRNGGGGC